MLFNYPVSSQLSLGIVQPPSLMLLPGFYFSPDHKALLVVMYTLPYMNWVYVSRCIFLCGHGFFFLEYNKSILLEWINGYSAFGPSISVPSVNIFLPSTVIPYLLSLFFP